MKSLDLVQFRDKLQKLTLPRVQEATAKIITKDVNLLRAKVDEFRQGKKPDGDIIGEYSSSPAGQKYRLFKMEINPLAKGNVDLILTRSTARQLGVDSLGNGVFQINSDDFKWVFLVGEYGEEIKSINPEVFENLQEDIYAPQLIEAMRAIANL